jgi:uncharacterized protein involved in cysteine biosynthesis
VGGDGEGNGEGSSKGWERGGVGRGNGGRRNRGREDALLSHSNAWPGTLVIYIYIYILLLSTIYIYNIYIYICFLYVATLTQVADMSGNPYLSEVSGLVYFSKTTQSYADNVCRLP